MIPSSPLAGQRVLVTRPAGQAERFRGFLEARGARVTVVPTIQVVPPPDPDRFDETLSTLGTYDWLVVTSANAVERVSRALQTSSLTMPASCRVAAVGPATARALAAMGVRDCLVPRIYRGEALAEAIIDATPTVQTARTRILVAQAEDARPALSDRLRAAGAHVDTAAAYSVHVNWSAQERLLEFIELARGDWLTFTASSAVRAFVELVGPQTGGASIATISPITAAAVVDVGLPVHAIAAEHSVPGLVDALVDAVGAATDPRHEVAR